MLKTRRMTKTDFDRVVSVLDPWFGGLALDRAHPVFFHELGDLALVAEDEGNMVGFLLGFLVPREPITAYVHLVGIHPAYRRQGVGRTLYKEFSSQCLSQNAKRLKAIAPMSSKDSIHFHSALGFAIQEDPNYAGTDRGRLVFTKDIGS